MTEEVHQIRYAWSESSLLGARGMGPVESSLPEEYLLTWDRHLRDHVWAAAPEPGFIFIVRDDVGALLRKVATTADGRPGSDAHVLLCEQMTAQDALGLTAWDDWGGPAGEVLPWSALQPLRDRGLEVLRARARAQPADRLAAFFAELLCAPGDPYTVIGEPDPLALTCALGDLIGQIPTFASDESDDTRSGLPTVVFLRKASFSPTMATRRRLKPAAEPGDPGLSCFAGAAVDAYIADGLAGIAVLRRGHAPGSLAEARQWANAMQFAPGVIADPARLPKLSEATLDGLTGPDALARIQSAAAAVSSYDLMHSVDPGLPPAIKQVFLEEALKRACLAPGDPALLQWLASFGSPPPEIIDKYLPADFDHLAHVTQVLLLSSGDRRALLEREARNLPVAAMVQWIDGHAATDPEGTLAVYSALCDQAPRASQEDLGALFARSALVAAVRTISESPERASILLVTLLRALPGTALSPDVAEGLAGQADPVLLHALDTLVTSPPAREAIHRQVRLAYYRDHHLHEPATLLPEDESADPKAWRLPLPSAFRRQPSHHRKPS